MKLQNTKTFDGEIVSHGVKSINGDPCTLCSIVFDSSMDSSGVEFLGEEYIGNSIECRACLSEIENIKKIYKEYIV